MATKIILTTDEQLTDKDVDDMSYLLSDALGEFAARRTPAREYVVQRYPGPDYYPDREEKVQQVERRITLARKLHSAALHPQVMDRLRLLQEMFGMTEEEAIATFNQLEDKRVSKLMASRDKRGAE